MVRRDHHLDSARGVEFTHRKQDGGHGQYARVRLTVEPFAGRYEFVNDVVGGRIPKEFIPAVDAGCRNAMRRGVLAGFEMTGVRVVLLDGDHHPRDSSDSAFRIAGAQAFREAVRHAGPVLLEPTMAVEVKTPTDCVGAVLGDLNARRGRIQAMDACATGQSVRALVPLAEMFGYVGDLRSRTAGRGSYAMRFDSYTEVPATVAAALIAG